MAYHELAELSPGQIPEADLVALTCDSEEESTVDEAIWTTCAAAADALIDGYIGRRAALPLEEVPVVVRQLSVDLTLVNLYRRRFGKLPEDVKDRLETAERRLRDIEAGRLSLGLQPAPSANTELTGRVLTRPRVFTRATMRGF